MKTNNTAIKTINLTNRFPNGLVSNDNNNFTVEYGKIHVLFGENGAGKSTFVKMLCGEITPTSGQIWINNQKIPTNYNPRIATEMKIGIVRQHFSLIDDFTVFENVVLGYELKSSKKREINFKNFIVQKQKLLASKSAQIENYRQKIVEIENLYAKQIDNLKTFPLQKTETETERLEKIKKLLNQKKLELKKYNFQNLEKYYDQKMTNLYHQKSKKDLTFNFNNKDIRKELQQIIIDFDLKINLNDRISEIDVNKQQQTEILKVLLRKLNIIIFDEPTSILPANQIKKFLNSLKKYKEQNKAIIFISHKINEIREIADEVSVLRQGKIVGNFKIDEISDKKLIKLMVGGETKVQSLINFNQPTTKLLEVRNLNSNINIKTNLQDINFSVFKGEIIGIAGIENNGQTDLLRGIYGLNKINSGTIDYFFENQKIPLHKLNIFQRQAKKIAFLSQDRIKESALIYQPLHINVAFNDLQNKHFFPNKIFNKKNAIERVLTIVKKYKVNGFQNYKQNVGSLSGGNIQKFLIGREMEKQPHLLLIDEPTWGIDIGAKNFIYNLFFKLKEQQKTIIFSSADLKEIALISDRIIVMSRGKIMGIITNTSNTNLIHKIGNLISGKEN